MAEPLRRGLLARFALDRPASRAWAMYDWANSAFMTTIVGAVFPVYFSGVAAAGLAPEIAQERFELTTVASLVAIALLAPVLGAIADFRAAKKRLLTAFALLGIASTAGMFLVDRGEWGLALLLFALSNVGAAGSFVFYDSLLPHVASPGELDRLSTSGYALGYVGGGVLLALNLAWILHPGWFGLPAGESLSPAQETLPARLAFLSVAVWWLVFTIPLWRRISEPPRRCAPAEVGGARLIAASFRQLRATWGELKRFRQATILLLAFLLYNDGIVTIIRMAAVYAKGKQMADEIVIVTFLLVQFVGIPFAFLFGQLAPRFGARRLVLAGLGVYCGISLLAFFMTKNWHFVALGLLVSVVQGGTQALSRSLFASLVPKQKSAEFFAFFAVGEKFAGIFGPLFFWLVTALSGSAQHAILAVIPFFVVGGLLLGRVDVAGGQRAARLGEGA
ncbi:MAG: MFS transporter [Planctomycetota bacterium]